MHRHEWHYVHIAGLPDRFIKGTIITINQITIIYPVFALAFLTFAVASWMGRLRFAAVKRGDLSARYYRLNRGGEVPEYLAKVSQNYDNLLELPILFYVVSVLLYVTNQV